MTAVALCSGGCHEVNDDRIPQMPVQISMADPALWNSYGVAGFGIFRYFTLQTSPVQPSGFPYISDSRTGFGGVLLIGGMDPYTGDTNTPLAYDLSCPVERSPEIRVYVDPVSFDAICPVCGSHYDVTMAAGNPISGPASNKHNRYGLKRYRCLPTTFGGYIVSY